MFFKDFWQNRQNWNRTIVIYLLTGTIFVKRSYFSFFPFTWKNRVRNTMVAYISYFISYKWSSKFEKTCILTHGILKKLQVDFFLPHMRWNTGGKLYIVTKWGEICKFFHLEFFSRCKFFQNNKNGFTGKFHLEKIIQLECTNHWVTHPTTNHAHQLDPLRHTVSY